jgi:hypothetical protein
LTALVVCLGLVVSAVVMAEDATGRPPRPNIVMIFIDDMGWPDLAARDGPWKLLIQYDGSGAQLYNLVDDPGETRDVSGDHADIVKKLRGSLLAWHKEMPPDAGASFMPSRKKPAAKGAK